jgi:murein DD-endopeptidase MepM/ murein hydrolase activator NlpD
VKLAAAALLLGLFWTATMDAGGRQDPEPTTSTTSTTIDPGSTTTLDPGSTTTADGGTTTSGGDGTSTTSGTTTTTEPERELPDHESDPDFQLADLVGENYRDQAAFDPNSTAVLEAQLLAAEQELEVQRRALRDAVVGRSTLEADLARLRAAIAGLDADERGALARTDEAREQFEDRAVEAYIRGNDPSAEALFGSADATDLASRTAMIEVVLEEDRDAIAAYDTAREDLGDDLLDLFDERTDAAREVDRLRQEEKSARIGLQAALDAVAVWEAGGQVVVPGFVFPVDGPSSFGDSWGAPRMPGTRYSHWHEGTDILAAAGTPLVACEDGVITRLDSHVLGGIGVTMRGAGGIEYYYAHLSSYAPGIGEGVKVEAGDVIGTVGATGNAVQAHLHFEVHIAGRAVNPYPLLLIAAPWQPPAADPTDRSG